MNEMHRRGVEDAEDAYGGSEAICAEPYGGR